MYFLNVEECKYFSSLENYSINFSKIIKSSDEIESHFQLLWCLLSRNFKQRLSIKVIINTEYISNIAEYSVSHLI